VAIHAPAALGAALAALGAEGVKVRVDPKSVPQWIVDRLAGARLVEEDDPCLMPKACKNPVELAGAREAHRRDGAAVTRFLAWLDREAPKGGLDELAAAERLHGFRRDTGELLDLSFETISGAGPNGAIVHYRVTEESNRPIESGTLYLVDSGGQYADGTTDITRTVAIGVPSDEMRDRFTRVLKGHIALATVRFPKGTTGAHLDTLARLPLWSAGLDYDHGTGHGVGSYLCVHEGPHRISKAVNTVALAPGMIVSNEPGYYKSGGYGIRIENLVVVAEVAGIDGAEREMLGVETLTLAPIDRRLVAPELLSDDELAWLNAYHARVRAELSGRVDPETATWLAQATGEITR
jgi:Xaa-Pro aminopeptidase